MIENPVNIAYFISPHGYGHAARASAVMDAISTLHPQVIFQVFTSVPKWFFAPSKSKINYHQTISDVGVIQSSPLDSDLEKTLQNLTNLYPLSDDFIIPLEKIIIETHCQAVFCDIAPAGILIAKHLSLPSILIENFTWDWIYKPYVKFSNKFEPIISYLGDLFNSATWHIQTVPFCQLGSNFDLRVTPVSRYPRNSISETRKSLNISADKKIVLFTMGGFGNSSNLPNFCKMNSDVVFLIPGNFSKFQRNGNIFEIPFRSDFYYPDLINAADLVIGKAGYSTLAEVFYAGIAYIVIHRDGFREADVLENFIVKNMDGAIVTTEEFAQEDMVPIILNLLKIERKNREIINGSMLIAQFIENRLFKG